MPAFPPQPAQLQTLHSDASVMEGLLQLVLDSVPSALSKAAYRRALLEFFSWFNRHRELGLTKATVQKFRTELEQRGLAPPSVNIRLSAIRRLAAEAADNGLMPPELAAGILRIKGARYRGAKIGTWLSPEQAVKLLSLPDRSSTKGRRDCAFTIRSQTIDDIKRGDRNLK